MTARRTGMGHCRKWDSPHECLLSVNLQAIRSHCLQRWTRTGYKDGTTAGGQVPLASAHITARTWLHAMLYYSLLVVEVNGQAGRSHCWQYDLPATSASMPDTCCKLCAQSAANLTIADFPCQSGEWRLMCMAAQAHTSRYSRC